MAALITTFFFFNDTATTEIYTLSLHDALPIYHTFEELIEVAGPGVADARCSRGCAFGDFDRSEEHTSELQSRLHLVCRLLLEKKKSLFKPRRIHLALQTMHAVRTLSCI